MIILPGRQNEAKQACMAAAREAQQAMVRLFAGFPMSKCECGLPVTYCGGKLLCEACGNDMDAVSWIKQYGTWFIKTTIFVPQKRFRLAVSTENDFDE